MRRVRAARERVSAVPGRATEVDDDAARARRGERRGARARESGDGAEGCRRGGVEGCRRRRRSRRRRRRRRRAGPSRRGGAVGPRRRRRRMDSIGGGTAGVGRESSAVRRGRRPGDASVQARPVVGGPRFLLRVHHRGRRAPPRYGKGRGRRLLDGSKNALLGGHRVDADGPSQGSSGRQSGRARPRRRRSRRVRRRARRRRRRRARGHQADIRGGAGRRRGSGAGVPVAAGEEPLRGRDTVEPRARRGLCRVRPRAQRARRHHAPPAPPRAGGAVPGLVAGSAAAPVEGRRFAARV